MRAAKKPQEPKPQAETRPGPGGSSMNEQNRKVRKPIAHLGATLAATVLMLVVLPMTAQAAESAWWQVLTSSRPGNMWASQNQVQALQAGPEGTLVSIEVTPVACMYSEFCPFFG